MLPFFKPRKSAGVMVSSVKMNGEKGEEHMEGEEDQGLMAASEELIRAVRQGDVEACARAWRAGFQILDSEPHEEGPHTNEEESNDYDSLNQRAAQRK